MVKPDFKWFWHKNAPSKTPHQKENIQHESDLDNRSESTTPRKQQHLPTVAHVNEALLVDEVPEASEPMYVNSKTDSDGDSTSMEYDDENQGFGASTSANQAPFGQTSIFGKTNTSFGNTSLFGTPAQPMYQSTSTPNFGGMQQPAAFGSTSTSVFGQQQGAATGFGATAGTSTFGQQNKGFSFSSPSGSIFGQQNQPAMAGSAFQPSTSGGMFGGTPAFGVGAAQAGTTVKFVPVNGSDTMQKGGSTHSINTKHHCITCMKEYEGKSLEELRWEDYQCNRKGPQQQQAGFSTGFGQPSSSASSIFGQTDNKGTFGQTTAFGQPTPAFGIGAQAPQTNLFGKPAATVYGSSSGTNTFGFNSSNVFGATNANTQQPQPPFGTPFFGQQNQQSATSIFPKSAQPSATFNTGFSFANQQQPQNTSASIFNTPKTMSSFGGFGQTPTTSTGFNTGSIFGQTPASAPFGSTFNKPAQAPFQPSETGFNLGATQQSSLFGGNKVQTGTMFPGFTGQATNPNPFGNTGTFPTMQGGFMMGQQAQSQQMPSDMAVLSQKLNPLFSECGFEVFPGYSCLEKLTPIPAPEPTNPSPKGIKKLLEVSTSPLSVTHGTERLKAFPINKPSGRHDKLMFLNAENDKAQPSNFCLKGSMGKRLVLTKARRTAHELEDSYKSMSNADPIISLKSSSSDTDLHRKVNGTPVGASASPLDITQRLPQKSSGDLRKKLELELLFSDSDEETAPKKMGDLSISAINKSQDTSLQTPVKDQQKSESRLLLQKYGATLQDDTSSSEDEAMPPSPSPHVEQSLPCGIKLTRPEYYTLPSLNELPQHANSKGECFVKGFTVGRVGYGNVHFPDRINVANLDLDEIVHIRHREIVVYRDNAKKPLVGTELNRPAQCTLENIYPKNPITNKPITDPQEIAKANFNERLVIMAERKDSRFVDYRPETGSFVFTVEHFSKYNFDDKADEEAREIQMKLAAEKKVKDLQQQASASTLETDHAQTDLESKPEYDAQEGIGKMLIPYGLGKIIPDYITQERNGKSLISSGLGGLIENTEEMKLLEEAESNAATMRGQSMKFTGRSQIITSMFLDDDSVSEPSTYDYPIATDYTPLPPAKVRPAPVRRYKLCNRSLMTLANKLLLGDRNYMDMAVFKRGSFKVGWCSGTSFYTIEKSSVINFKLVPLVDHDKDPFKPGNLEEHLRLIYDVTEKSYDNESVSMQMPRSFNNLIPKQASTFQSDTKGNLESGYYKNIFCLVAALFGHRAENTYDYVQLVKEWAQGAVGPVIREEICKEDSHLQKIFLLLCCSDVREAAKLALENDMPQLSLLISQSRSFHMKKHLTQLLSGFCDEDKSLANHINPDVMKIYCLVAGSLSYVGGDWLRQFMIYIVYFTENTYPLTSIIENFEKLLHDGQFEWPYVKHTESPCSSVGSTEARPPLDIIYHILKLAHSISPSLEELLDPITHTPDRLDYRLSWLLLQDFTAADAGKISEGALIDLHLSFSNQLEGLGLWQWSIFVALFLPDFDSKKNTVTGILMRNLEVPSTEDSLILEKQLVNYFHLPVSWIQAVKGYKSLSQKRYHEAFTYFCYAGIWDKASAIARNELLPSLVIEGMFEDIHKILIMLHKGKGCIQSWQSEENRYLLFIELLNEMAEYKEDDYAAKVSAERKFADFCADSSSLSGKNSLKHAVSMAEMSRKMVNYPLDIDFKQIYINDLPMPTDYIKDELDKLMWDKVSKTVYY